eukprot:s4789_g3.t1
MGHDRPLAHRPRVLSIHGPGCSRQPHLRLRRISAVPVPRCHATGFPRHRHSCACDWARPLHVTRFSFMSGRLGAACAADHLGELANPAS